ncbi:MAG: 3-keto-5-aminohexanoate cleavage protein [Bacteroidota bacterium]
MNNKTVINFCPTGMVPVKTQNPSLPVTPDEVIEQVHEAYELGITIAHLHARDAEEKPTWKLEVYRDIFEGVRKYCPDLIICGSTSGRSFSEFEKRSAVIELRPDMCSLTLSSLNFSKQASVNSPGMITSLAVKMNEYGVRPELECFDLGMINFGNYLAEKKVIQSPCYWNLIFGNIAGFQAEFSQVGAAVTAIQQNGGNNYIAFGGIGPVQITAVSLAIAVGYGVRIGLEDNIWHDRKKSLPASNKELLTQVHLLMQIHNRKLFTSAELGKAGFYNAAKSYIGVQ